MNVFRLGWAARAPTHSCGVNLAPRIPTNRSGRLEAARRNFVSALVPILCRLSLPLYAHTHHTKTGHRAIALSTWCASVARSGGGLGGGPVPRFGQLSVQLGVCGFGNLFSKGVGGRAGRK